MKRKIISSLSLFFVCVILASCSLFGVKSGEVKSAKVLEKSENLVVIQVEKCGEGATVFNAMQWLKEKGELEFVSEPSAYGESLLSLNGKDNPADWSFYWQFYVCDEAQGNVDLTYVYEENTCYYANAGISGITVQDGGIYLWVFEDSAW